MSSEDISKDQERFDYYADTDAEFSSGKGLTEDTVRLISDDKGEPDWMLEKRLQALEIFNQTPMPDWNKSPDLSELNIEEIIPYIRPDVEGREAVDDWDDLPNEIQDTFDKLGIPDAEKNSLSGVGSQYESEVVYQNMQERWEEKGVIFCDMDTALRDHEEIVKEHFMNKCVPPSDNKFAALHGAVWSGGSFLYVPEGTVVDMPVQAYFRMNSENMGQFEHTLIIAEDGAEVHYIEGCSAPKYAASSLHAGGVEVFVGENAHVQYSTIQNWSKNTYNLNTKRAIVSANGTMEWISGSMGSKATMLYPSTMLNGVGATDNHITIAFAGSGQNIDTGAKVYHNAPQTTSTVESKSISTDGGRTNYRGLIHVSPSAKNSKTNVECVPEGSQIYTKSGYKPIQNIEIGELVLTHTGEFEPVQKCIENKNTEELLEFVVAGSGTSIVTTGNHPLLSDARTQYPNRQENKEFNLRWRDAEDIGKGDYLAVPRPDLDTHFSSDSIHNKYGDNYSKTLS